MGTAETDRLHRLFHYQPFDIDRLRPIVFDRQIYFSKPANFNDPWDCKPYFNRVCLSDPDTLERYVAWYINVTRNCRPDISEAEIQLTAARYRLDADSFSSKIHEFSSAMAAGISEHFRVYCLSTKHSCELMWAHYADKHQGVCLEFALPNPVFDRALRVSYSEAYPFFDLTDSDTERNLMILLNKSIAWAYEDEYRLVSQEEYGASQHDTLVTRDGILRLPEASLTAIIVGSLAPEATITAIKRLIVHASHPIQLRRAVRAFDRYKLDVV